ncbi:FKBP-type peptidyl-prolyl cis-trans isomerase [Paenimyroides aestuarii]|uniref:Peptidyl-prolyl cis-trans isomerase n=1 Tax=Paenimyroides aestuarii TaxID=2968490 RepID=A0ABY5NWI0_9FLAO|nr:FKBP-type peptidyl-prolyl cis-trans isomerase [Paenimyroides aestuarii]
MIDKVEIVRVGKDAKKFNAAKTFTLSLEKIKKEEELKKQKAAILRKENKTLLDNYLSKATDYPSGIKIYVAEKGAGIKPTEGEKISFDYAGYLADGTLFDTGIEELAIKQDIFNPQRKAANAYKPLDYTFGNKGGFIEGMTEGLLQLNKGDKAYIFIPSNLGYGERAMGPIPANSNLVFYVDIKP